MGISDKDKGTIMKGAFVVFVAIFLGKFLMYLTKGYLARYLGPTDYGLFALSLTIFTIIVTFSNLGINEGIVRFVASYVSKKDWARVKGSLYSGINIVLPFSILMSVVVFIFAGNISTFFEKDITIYLKIFSLAIPFFVTYRVFHGFLRGLKRMKQMSMMNNVYSNFMILVFSFIGVIYYGLVGAVSGFVIGYILRFFISVFYSMDVIRKKNRPKLITKELIKFSWPLTIVVLIWSVAGYLDTMMLGYFRSSAEVGVYNVSYLVSGLLTIIYSAFVAIYYPLGSEYFSKKRDIKPLYKQVTKWMFSVAYPSFLILLFFSSTVIRIFFGSEYLTGYISLSILSFAFFFSILVGPCAETLNVLGKPKWNTLNVLVMVFIDFILNYYLIQSYGILGCAIATTIAMVVLNLMGLIEVWYLNKINPFDFDFLKAGIFGFVLMYGFYYSMMYLKTFLDRFVYDILKIFGFGVFMVLFLGFSIKIGILDVDFFKNRVFNKFIK